MGMLPVYVDEFFDDFKDSLIECEIVRNGKTISKVDGMPNNENGEYIMFKYGVDVQVGDVIYSEHGNDVVKRVVIDKYEGSPNAIRAYV